MSRYKKYETMKAESVLSNETIFMQPAATSTDPLAQPQRKTGRGVGENQSVLGK